METNTDDGFPGLMGLDLDSMVPLVQSVALNLAHVVTQSVSDGATKVDLELKILGFSILSVTLQHAVPDQ